MSDNEDARIASYYSLAPAEYPVVTSLRMELLREPGSAALHVLELTLRRIDLAARSGLRLTFWGVRQLRIAQPEGSLFDAPLIEIKPTGNIQWEGMNYRVEEVEDRTFSLFCDRFDASLVDLADPLTHAPPGLLGPT